jgi:DNA polymerase-4
VGASLDEAYLAATDHLRPFGSATAIAREIRRRVREERGLTVSVGVGPNRLLAKVASAFDTPDGLTVAAPGKVRAVFGSIARTRRPMGGPTAERALAAMGITTVAELRSFEVGVRRRPRGRQG